MDRIENTTELKKNKDIFEIAFKSAIDQGVPWECSLR